MSRPLLFLDVDGVLNPFGAGCPPGYTEHELFPGEEPVRVNPVHGTWVAELAAVFDVIWATGWNENAGDRPAVWIDDGHTAEARVWARYRQAPTRLVTADPAAGLTRAHVDQVLGWVARLGRAQAGKPGDSRRGPREDCQRGS